MNADGADKHLVTRYLGFSDNAPGPWLAGEQWAFIDAGAPFGHVVGEGGIYLLNMATGEDLPVSLPDGYWPTEVALSPDATKLAFGGVYVPDPEVLEDHSKGLWVYELGSGQVSQLLTERVGKPKWAPDSRHLVVSCGIDGASYTNEREILVLDSVTGEVLDFGLRGAAPVFSPDAMSLAYCGGFQQDGRFLRGTPDAGSIMVLDLSTVEEPLQVSPTGEGALEPKWSPDGTQIAYWVHRDLPDDKVSGKSRRAFTLHIADAAGLGTCEVYGAEGWPRAIAWGRSGKSIYVAGDDGVVLVAADGSGLVADLGGNAQDSVLSRAEQEQVQGATHTLKQVRDLLRDAMRQEYLAQTGACKGSYERASELLSSLIWDYSLAAYSYNDVLRHMDMLDAKADRSSETVLEKACAERLGALEQLLLSYATPGEFPAPAEYLEHTRRASRAREASGDETAWYFNAASRCAWGDAHGTTVLYEYHAPADSEPPLGHAIITCPIHPENRIIWDELLAKRLERARERYTAERLGVSSGD